MAIVYMKQHNLYSNPLLQRINPFHHWGYLLQQHMKNHEMTVIFFLQLQPLLSQSHHLDRAYLYPVHVERYLISVPF